VSTAAEPADAAALAPATQTAADDAPAPATRERLLHAAREVIEAGGYGRASVLAIAERAGVASGTLYRHFPSKAELFVEVFREVCGREMAEADRAAASAHGAVAQLDAVIAVFAERALANPTLAWSLIAEPVDPAVERVRLEFRSAYRTRVAGYLRDAVGEGDVPEQDPELTAAALVGAANEVLAGPLAPAHGHRDPGTVVEALRTLWRRASGV